MLGLGESVQQVPKEEKQEVLVYPYLVMKVLGEGTYGKVFKCINQVTNDIVALKRNQIPKDEEHEGIPSTTLRELSALTQLKGMPGIVTLLDVILTKDYKQYLVFEYLKYDLKKYQDQYRPLSKVMVQIIMYQIIRAVYICHSYRIFHRDIKPANVLLDENGLVKLADFGLSKSFGYPLDRTHSKEVQTLWYRAPELLLGNQCYSAQLDMFSIGCIFGEMLFGRTLFKGGSEIDQIFKIFEFMGTPQEDEVQEGQKRRCSTPQVNDQTVGWEGLSYLPHYSKTKFPRFKGKRWAIVYDPADKLAFDLLFKLLELDPKKRLTSKEAIQDAYFDTLDPETKIKLDQGII